MFGYELSFCDTETEQLALVLLFFGCRPFRRASTQQEGRRRHGNELDCFFANVLINFAQGHEQIRQVALLQKRHKSLRGGLVIQSEVQIRFAVYYAWSSDAGNAREKSVESDPRSIRKHDFPVLVRNGFW